MTAPYPFTGHRTLAEIWTGRAPPAPLPAALQTRTKRCHACRRLVERLSDHAMISCQLMDDAAVRRFEARRAKRRRT